MQFLDSLTTTAYKPEPHGLYGNTVYISVCPECDFTTKQKDVKDLAMAELLIHASNDHPDIITTLLKEITYD